MRKSLFLVALLAALMTGCHSEEQTIKVAQEAPRSFYLTLEGADLNTRASLDVADATGFQSVLWGAGDCISIFPEVNENHEYQTQTDGQSYAEFTRTSRPEIVGDPVQSHAGVFYAVSPWHLENTMVDGMISLRLLAEQSAPVDQPMAEVLLMSAKSDTENFYMKNNVALLRFRFAQEGLDGLVVSRIRVTSQGHLLAGRGLVDPTQDEPGLAIQNEAGAAQTISFTPSDRVEVKSVSEGYICYYLAIAPGQYDDLVLEFETSKGTYVNNLTGSIVPCMRSKYFTLNKTFRPDELTGDTSTSPYIEDGEMEL